MGHFQGDCKYDGDKPIDSQQVQGGQTSFDSYDPVVGKWMTNLVANQTHYRKSHERSVCSIEQAKRPQADLPKEI